MENIIIVGSGPAGLTAAIYAARASLNPLVIDGMQPGGQLTQTTDIENFPGFEQPISGQGLVATMRKQAERFGVRFMMDEIQSVNFSAPVKTLDTMMNGVLEARAVILATGAKARYLGVPNEGRLLGHGVSACATCDGAFFKGQDVAVIGGGDTAMEDALYLSRMAHHVTVVHRRDAFRASKIMADRVLSAENITVVWNAVVVDVLGDAQVSGVMLKDVKTGVETPLKVTGLFVAIGHAPNTMNFKEHVACDAEGYIVAEHTRTSVAGVFAAGDVADPKYKQAIIAAGSGAVAALEAERYLIAE